MPIYEYVCSQCEHFYEALVKRPGEKAPCPECGSKRVKQAMSAPAAFSIKGGDTTCPSTGGSRPPGCGAGTSP